MITVSTDPATIERSLRRLLDATREHQTDEFLYGRVTPRLRAGAKAIHWMEAQGTELATEQEFAACPTFAGNEKLAADTLTLLCAIGAVTWQPNDTDDIGNRNYYVNLG